MRAASPAVYRLNHPGSASRTLENMVQYRSTSCRPDCRKQLSAIHLLFIIHRFALQLLFEKGDCITGHTSGTDRIHQDVIIDL
jgi:hypothetical protein